MPFSRTDTNGAAPDGICQLVDDYRILIAIPFVLFAAFDVLPAIAVIRNHQLVLLDPLIPTTASLSLYFRNQPLLLTEIYLKPLAPIVFLRAPAV